MKTLFLFTLTVVLALNLSARENPFEMNSIFEEENGKILETNENPMTPDELQEQHFIKEAQQGMSNNSSENKNSVEDKKNLPITSDKALQKTYSKQEVDSLIQKTKTQTEQKTKEIVKKEIAKTEPEQVVYVKPRGDVGSDEALVSKKLLPFLKVEFNDNKLILHTEHKVSKKFSVNQENKLIIDYKADVTFNTKKEELESKSFKRVTLGNHTSEGYFRVAIELLDKPSKFEVTYTNDLITITKKD